MGVVGYMNEKYNTMRRLEGKPLLPTSWLCRFGWHSWDRWREAITDNKASVGYWKQYRTCIHCGRQEIKKAIGDSRVNY